MESDLRFVEQFFEALAIDRDEPSQKSREEMIEALRGEIQGLVRQTEQPPIDEEGATYATLR